MPSVFEKPVGEEKPDSLKEAIGYGALNVLLFLMISYPGASFIRELLGWRGVAISPLLAAVVVWPVSVLVVYTEPRAQKRPWWPRIEKVWRWAGAVLYTCPPLVLALTFPLAVGCGLSTGIPTLISLSPPVLLMAFFILRRRWRDRRPGGSSAE
ncbi:hypothetical protein SMD11_0145 [Streptomyces albireticuli]|uniref:Uncharacterized protein n=1 Tax=Streptomyces albireticuli TaxID=1940 RepID=A0A1Z2KV37_9ACTN|nr:hypothetical protein [Streptomyces albireticuli]ARZ65811.1 hypothetical protein SMD11_0145 [Streptomyces albireticuli]